MTDSGKNQIDLAVAKVSVEKALKDYKEKHGETALDACTLLAKKGDVQAQTIIGYFYFSGVGGVSLSYFNAYMWLTIAVTNGSGKSLEIRDTAATQMTSEQIEQAQDLAKKWMKENKNA